MFTHPARTPTARSLAGPAEVVDGVRELVAAKAREVLSGYGAPEGAGDKVRGGGGLGGRDIVLERVSDF